MKLIYNYGGVNEKRREGGMGGGAASQAWIESNHFYRAWIDDIAGGIFWKRLLVLVNEHTHRSTGISTDRGQLRRLMCVGLPLCPDHRWFAPV